MSYLLKRWKCSSFCHLSGVKILKTAKFDVKKRFRLLDEEPSETSKTAPKTVYAVSVVSGVAGR